ncbi:hypothetical protein QBC46DRAFT_445026 [Diplogelasinospora grovesii]|uniref:Uncharacterized protein n=1 Tax=Diplogelasinospora grovesii TaxID=303347 RepID=A0AAN6SAA8_9PEZI|nr:hypothetical protein QBC46DRAFT_445026 [Diplogelasinospora grovesii]
MTRQAKRSALRRDSPLRVCTCSVHTAYGASQHEQWAVLLSVVGVSDSSAVATAGWIALDREERKTEQFYNAWSWREQNRHSIDGKNEGGKRQESKQRKAQWNMQERGQTQLLLAGPTHNSLFTARFEVTVVATWDEVMWGWDLILLSADWISPAGLSSLSSLQTLIYILQTTYVAPCGYLASCFPANRTFDLETRVRSGELESWEMFQTLIVSAQATRGSAIGTL